MTILKFATRPDAPESATTPCLVVGLYEERMLGASAQRIDAATGGAIRRLLESGDATGKPGTTMLLFGLPGIAAERVLLVGLGEQKKFDAAAYHRAANDAARALKGLPIASAYSTLAELDVPGRDAAWKLRTAALAADAQAYRYTATFKPKDAPKSPQLQTLEFSGSDGAALAEASAIASGVRFAKELGNLPPNICNPAWIAAQAKHIADRHAGVTLEVLERDDMKG